MSYFTTLYGRYKINFFVLIGFVSKIYRRAKLGKLQCERNQCTENVKHFGISRILHGTYENLGPIAFRPMAGYGFRQCTRYSEYRSCKMVQFSDSRTPVYMHMIAPITISIVP